MVAAILNLKTRFFLGCVLFVLNANAAFAQTTAFTYQGKLTDNNVPANAAYDMLFRLFDEPVNGNQIGATLTFDGTGSNPPSVSVTNGLFTVTLDFGGAALSGADRFLEINVRPAGNPGGYQQLLPRQKLTSAPYAVQAINATNAANAMQLGGVAASQYVVTNDARLSDARQPLAGSANYIQNTALQQPASGFNISGNGTAGGTLSANAVTATTQYNIGGFRVLSRQGNENIFVGAGTGQSNTTGGGNSFVGANAGFSNTTGQQNSFFGNAAGSGNLTGGNNSFFGFAAGNQTTANNNSFFGYLAGAANTSGQSNAFFGSGAGQANQTGLGNAFFGYNAGKSNTTVGGNSFFGWSAGESNTTGVNNAFFGYLAGNSNTTGVENSFFGNYAGQLNTTAQGNSFFGTHAGNGTTGNGNSFFGRDAGLNTTGDANAFFGDQAGGNNRTGSNNTLIGSFADVGSSNLDHATAIGSGAVASLSNSIYLGRADGSDAVRIPGPVVINGSLVVGTLGSAGSTSICLNVANRIAPCSSSLRYKTRVQAFSSGLDVVRRLRPIAFEWRDGGLKDVGFAAEDVHAIAPLLTTTNQDGQIEGVKYAQLTTVLVNAINEQQTQIDAQKELLAAQRRALQEQQQQNQVQQKQLQKQQGQLEALIKLVCSSQPQAEVCK